MNTKEYYCYKWKELNLKIFTKGTNISIKVITYPTHKTHFLLGSVIRG